jgi:enolase
MSPTIVSAHAREILDSRGRPTVEVELRLSDGTTTRASVPSGASTGRHEAVERRDGDPERYGGRGVLRAVEAVNTEIAATIHGADVDLAAVDQTLIELDGTPDKSRLGANAILAVSLACARAEAAVAGQPLWRHLAAESEPVLPMPMVNVISGGLHAGRQLDFQDFLVMPVGAESYREALRTVIAVYEATADVLRERGLSVLKADEGGFGPALESHAAALELLDVAVDRAGLRIGDDIAYALDVAATHFYDPRSGTYELASEGRTCTAQELEAVLRELADRHPVLSVEDALAEDDWDGWTALTAALGDRLQIVGDDLFTTNLERLERGIERGAANAVLVKMNQIGTISETLAVVDGAKAAGYRTVISARSGETEDPALADLAVGTAGGQIKVGSVAQSERLAKYNQLLRIEEELCADAYAGRAALALEQPA